MKAGDRRLRVVTYTEDQKLYEGRDGKLRWAPLYVVNTETVADLKEAVSIGSLLGWSEAKLRDSIGKVVERFGKERGSE